MKLHGKKIEAPNEELIVIPRGEKEPIVLKAKAVLSYDDFDRICPFPVPPKGQKPGGDWVEYPDDPDYIKLVERYAERKHDWMYIQSLKATETLEWETVKDGDPDTWKNWLAELQASGFASAEVVRIRNGIRAANCLDERLVQKAVERFRLSQQAAQPAS